MLEAARPARDREDLALRQIVASSTRALPFSCSDLLKFARLDAALRAALDAVTIQSSNELGCWLRSARGTRDGVTIERLKRRQWRAFRAEP